MEQLSKDALAVEQKLQGKPGAYTLGDIATMTGMPVLESEYAVKELMGKYHSKLAVSEQGDLLYDFGQSLNRRGDKTFAERFQNFQKVIWRAFKFFYKFLISVVLVVYFVLFIVILLALVVAMMSGGRDNDSRGGGNAIFAIIREMFFSIFRYNTHYRARYRPWDKWGYPYPHYEPRKTNLPHKDLTTPLGQNPKPERLEEKSYIASIYDFVFGPPRIDDDPLSNHKEVASYLRKTKGIISTSEVQALAGWTREDASDFMTTCLAEFDGKPKVNANGTLYGEFDDLVRSNQSDEELSEIEFYWDEYEAEYELTGNNKKRNAVIIAMNIFNLAFSGYFLIEGFTMLPVASLGLTIFLGWFPLAYSITFFLIPFIRSFYITRMQRKQHIENIRKRLMQVIFKKHREQISLQELTAVANQWRTSEEKLDEKTVKQVIEDFIIDLDGRTSVDNNGAVVYDFHQLNRELTDMEEIRQIKIMDSDIEDKRFLS